MSLAAELKRVFGKNSVSWKSIAKSAASVSWDDWQENAADSQSLVRVFDKKSEDLQSLADRFSRNLDVITRNSVAFASAEKLGLARLVLVRMLHEGHLSGKPSDWLSDLPKPSPTENFLSHYLKGKFQPTQAAFSELLEEAKNTGAESNCLECLIFSSGSALNSTSSLLSNLLRHKVVKELDVNRLFAVLEGLVKSEKISADLSLAVLQKLPKDWRTHILADGRRAKAFSEPKVRERLAKQPFLLTETREAIAEADLRDQLCSELKERKVNISTLEECLLTEGFLKRLDKLLDWRFAGSLMIGQCEGSSSQNLTSLLDRIKISKSNPSAANIGLLLLVWASHSQPASPPYKTPKSLSKLVKVATLDVLKLALRSSRGVIQRDLHGLVSRVDRPALGLRDLAALILAGHIDGNTDTETLLGVLADADDKSKKKAYSVAISDPAVGLRLLRYSEDFQDYYTAQIKRNKFPKYVLSDAAFETYQDLGNAGAELLELLLSRADKITPFMTVSEMLDKVSERALGIAPAVFGKRGVTIRQFVSMAENLAFLTLGASAQQSIFELQTPTGKNAFQSALKKREISDELFDRLEDIRPIRSYLVRYTAPRISKKKATLPELLSSLVFTPSLAEEVAANYSSSQLRRALPKALAMLEERTRVAAALELAVLSDLVALPVFLELVKRLAPPFKAKHLGRRFDDLYTIYELPKKSGGTRTISAPAPHLKMAQRALLQLLYREKLSKAAVGFVPGKSIRDNACHHVGQDIVVNADIKGFFPSTTYKQVYGLSRRLAGEKLSPMAARLFSEICCHDGHLATGAPTSPAASNLILKTLDEALLKISTKLCVSYSRYADDVTFSGDSAAVWMLKPLTSHLERLGYELDPKKTNIFRKGRRQSVTGAVVNEKVTLARPLRKKLRAAVHRRVSGGTPEWHGQAMSDQVLKGYLAYLFMLSPEHAKPLLAKLEALGDWKH